MKILIATKQGQGVRRNDFHHATEGEIVSFGSECTGEKIDGGCGCRRSLAGLDSRRASTTFQVIDRPDLDAAGLADLIAASLVGGGWYADKEAAKKHADVDAGALADVAGHFPEGTILERRGNRFQARPVPVNPTTRS